MAPASVDRVLARPGRPLEPALRRDMEQRFGHDFSPVRVHSDTDAWQSARDVNAHAYTVGHNIVFGEGRLAPGTGQGRRLIAHELTHVLQQRSARTSATPCPLSITATSGVARVMRAPADEFESLFAEEITAASSAPVGGAPAAEPVPMRAMSPDELVQYIINQRGFHSTAPRQTRNAAGELVPKRGSVTPTIDPKMIGEPLGLGYETHAVIQVYDAEGRLVATELGAFSGSYQTHAPKGMHAEAQGAIALRRRLANVDVSGGRLVAAVDQFVCPACHDRLYRLAESLGLKSFEVYGPTRESMVTSEAPVTPKTAASTAAMAGRPPVRAESIEGASLLRQGTSVPELVPKPVPGVKGPGVPPVGTSAVRAAVTGLALNVLLFAVAYYLNKWHDEEQVRKFNSDIEGLRPEINTRLKNKVAEVVAKEKEFPLVYSNITIVYTRDDNPIGPQDYNEGSMSVQDVAISHQNYQKPEKWIGPYSSQLPTARELMERKYSLTFSVPIFEEETVEPGASSMVRKYRAVSDRQEHALSVAENLTNPDFKVRLSTVLNLHNLAAQDPSLETLVIRDLLGMLKDGDEMVRLSAVAALRDLKAKIGIQYIREVLQITKTDEYKKMIQRDLDELEQG